MAGLTQESDIEYLQQGATANGNGTPVNTAGYTGAIQVEIQETAGGTCTVTLQGSFDGTTWYAVGYQRVDAQATLTRAVTGISVTANLKAVFQVLDPYPELRAPVSASAAENVTVKAYLVPA